MRRTLSIFLIITLTGLFLQPLAFAQYTHSYEHYLAEANDALRRHDHNGAIKALESAHHVSPSQRYPLEKIKTIKDLMKQDRYKGANDIQSALSSYRKNTDMGQKAFNQGDYKKASYYFHQAALDLSDKTSSQTRINLTKRMQEGRVLEVQDVASRQSQDRVVMAQTGKTKRAASAPKALQYSKQERSQVLTLDDMLWATQPKTQLQIQQGSSIVLEGKNIDRFLVITPGVVNVERIDRDHLRMSGVQIGTTFVHLWDERGRWTFYVQGIFPVQFTDSQPQVPTEEKHASPFKFSYSIDGGTVYRGPDIPSAERQSLNMQQTLGLKGETPYGVADGSISYYKFARSTEATNYTVGLSGVKGLGFTGVNLRGYDAVKYFSPLTFPGQYFRGFLIEGKALNEKLAGAYVHGQDRFTYSYVSPGVVEDRRSYIEGARVTVFPNEENQYSFNYARGYGSARQSFLKNQVYSLEAQQRIHPVLLKGEVATNTDTLAETLSAQLGSDRQRLRVNFRDIDNDFTTITGLPSNQGEIGANIGMDLDYDAFDVYSSLDFYRDRFLPNADDPDAINYDFNTSFQRPLDERTDFLSTVYYLDTPGELSPRRNFRWMNTLSQRYKIWADRDLRAFVGASYHRNRVKQTPISEYDRYSASAGVQIGLIKHLNYFVNYEYSWVNELLSGDYVYPGVLNMGLTYATELTRKTSFNTSLYYRDEQNAVGANSFLAGEDSITGGLGFSYRPTQASELFIDSRARNVWKENPDNQAYNEIDVRWGLRSQWDLPFSWSPSGTIRGIVFKDLDADGERDSNEPGIPGVHVRIGKREAVTDRQGRYKKKVRAKEVLVSADSATLADGYVLTTPAIVEVKIPHEPGIDFGFSTQSGIYGIVFHDQNDDGQPNEGDELIQKVKIILDGKAFEISDYDGTYFFKNVSEGRHTLRLDVNSLPIEYIPLVKLVNSINVSEGTTYIFHIPLKKKITAED